MEIKAKETRPTSTDRVTDLVDSVKAYAVQETVGPLRGAARWLAFGTAASVFLGLGVLFLGVGTLRMSQEIGGSVLDGSWSFIHYLFASLVLGVAVWMSLSRISKTSLRRD